MSSSTSTALPLRISPRRPSATGSTSLFQSPGPMLLLGVVLGVCLGWHNVTAVWQTGKFADTDDAMHMVQVREWMAGKGWFDLLATRMDPPHGVAMHWSRITDIPIAFLARTFGLVLQPDMAERAMRIAYSALLQLAFFAAVISLARRLVGPRGIGVAVVLAATSATLFGQLEFGRLSHQNVQVVLMMLALRAMLEIFEPGRRLGCVALGLVCALSLSISLEDLPFIAVVMAVAGGTWIARGPTMAPQLAWLGGSFALAALAAFFATVPPANYIVGVCDAFSAPHLIAAMIGGFGFCLLAGATTALSTPWLRAIAAAAAGGGALAAVACTYPACLGDPFGAVDPQVRHAWLEQVSESQPLGSLLLHHFFDNVPIAAPLLIGLATLCVAVMREGGEARLRWIAVAAIAAIGVAGGFWQVRMASYAGAVTIFGGVWLFVRMLESGSRSARLRPLVAGLAMLPFSAVTWAAAVPQKAAAKGAWGDADACFSSAAFAALDSLPRGLIFSGIDPGPFILAHTAHSVVTGPYHRDNRGLRLTVDAMLGDAQTARARIAASGADYVAICTASKELASYVDQASHGFAEQLRAGAVPAWLQPVAVAGSPYRVWRVVK